MKTWQEAVQRTWLADARSVEALDNFVRRALSSHRALSEHELESVAPWSVQTLVQKVKVFGNDSAWLWCVVAIALLQELIFCAEDGEFNTAGFATDADLARDVEALRAVRNVALHPAFQLSSDGQPSPMERLITLLEGDDDHEVTDLALRLPSAWSYFAERPTAAYALRKLGSAGRLFIERNRLLSSENDLTPPMRKHRRIPVVKRG